MIKVKSFFVVLFLFSVLVYPVNALVVDVYKDVSSVSTDVICVDLPSFYEVKSGVRTEYYKDSAGYDRILRPDRTILVSSQRWTVEYLSGKSWKQIGVPFEVVGKQIGDNVRVERRYQDYAGTQIEVIYHASKDSPTKMDVVINSGADRVYRIVWNLDGINNEAVSYGKNYVNFTGTEDWVVFDWSDAFNQYGNISSYEVSESANGKKLEVIFNVGLIKKGSFLVLDPTVKDSYTTAHQSSGLNMYDHHPSDSAAPSAAGQVFNATSTFKLGSVKFYLEKNGSPGLPTGNAVAALYATSGTYGTNMIPTGAALATSSNFNISTLTTNYLLYEFFFTTAYECQFKTQYAVIYQLPASGSGTIDANNYVVMGIDNTSPSHSGNFVKYINGTWTPDATQDGIFYVIDASPPSNDAVISTSTFIRNVSGWVNVTVTDLDLVANLKTVDILVNTNNNTESFTLRWTQATNVFSEVSDSNNIITLNVSGSKRVNIDTDTDKIAYNFTMTGGTDGLVNVTVTSIDDSALSDVTLFEDEFEYITIIWDPATWLINSAVDLLGGPGGFIGLLNTYATGIYVYVSDALTNMLSLIVQVFVVINGVFGFIINWTTRMVSLLVDVFTLVRDIVNGSTTAISGLTNWWSTMNFAEWGYDFVPIAILISWMGSLDKRGKIQGWNTVFFGDISTIMNILSFFSQWFGLVINTSIDFAFKFVDLIQNT